MRGAGDEEAMMLDDYVEMLEWNILPAWLGILTNWYSGFFEGVTRRVKACVPPV